MEREPLKRVELSTEPGKGARRFYLKSCIIEAVREDGKWVVVAGPPWIGGREYDEETFRANFEEI